MQAMAQIPIFADVADIYYQPVLTASNNTDAISIAAANGTANGYLTVVNQAYFALVGFGCWTNYDNAGGVVETVAVTAEVLAGPPFVPNNFTVKIAREQNNEFSNLPLTQAELCSAGAFSGKQLPYPVIYGPSTTFNFQFTDTTGLYLLTEANAAIPLQIKLWAIGYKIPISNWEKFQEYFPGFRAEYK